MTSENPAERLERTRKSHPLLTERCSPFQWRAAFPAALGADWQDQLTHYLLASATASVSFPGEDPLPVLEAQTFEDPLNLYQVTLRKLDVEVRVSYGALNQAGMDTPYDCHLWLRTGAGGRVVTIVAPQPPNQAKWKHFAKQAWNQLVLRDAGFLVIPAAPDSLAKIQPLSRFRYSSALGWEEADASASSSLRSEWHRDLWWVLDAGEPHRLGAQVGWKDSPSLSHRGLERVRITRPEPSSTQAKYERATAGWDVAKAQALLVGIDEAVSLVPTPGARLLRQIRRLHRRRLAVPRLERVASHSLARLTAGIATIVLPLVVTVALMLLVVAQPSVAQVRLATGGLGLSNPTPTATPSPSATAIATFLPTPIATPNGPVVDPGAAVVLAQMTAALTVDSTCQTNTSGASLPVGTVYITLCFHPKLIPAGGTAGIALFQPGDSSPAFQLSSGVSASSAYLWFSFSLNDPAHYTIEVFWNGALARLYSLIIG